MIFTSMVVTNAYILFECLDFELFLSSLSIEFGVKTASVFQQKMPFFLHISTLLPVNLLGKSSNCATAVYWSVGGILLQEVTQIIKQREISGSEQSKLFFNIIDLVQMRLTNL